MIVKKSYARVSTVAAVATFVISIGLSTPSSAVGFPAEPQSRPPVNSGASGGANPGNSGGQGGYNPGYNGPRGSITVYRDANYRGASIRFDNDVPNLSNTGLNDAVSSMRFEGEGRLDGWANGT